MVGRAGASAHLIGTIVFHAQSRKLTQGRNPPNPLCGSLLANCHFLIIITHCTDVTTRQKAEQAHAAKRSLHCWHPK
jgi:hypothetical protein